jgi:magnesium-protoporphyrin IX monomethyl ester (oxidative) cyclase
LRVSPESSSQETLDKLVGKQMTLSSFEKVAQCCQKIDLQLCAFWVIGIPGETVQDMRDTLEYAKFVWNKYGTIPRISIATPFPGTELYKQCVENKWLDKKLTPSSLAAATRFRGLIRTPEFGPEDISELLDSWETWR